MHAPIIAISVLTLAATLWPAVGNAKDTHAAKAAAVPAEHGDAAPAKGAAGKDAHGGKPAAHGTAAAKPAADNTHAVGIAAKAAEANHAQSTPAAAGARAASRQDRTTPAGNDLPSVALRIKQRMQEAVASRTQKSGPVASPAHAAAGSSAAHAAPTTDGAAARRMAPAVASARIRLSWRLSVRWPAELDEKASTRTADGRIALAWR